MKHFRVIASTAASLCVWVAAGAPASAEECGTRWNGDGVPGTLTSASKPCAPAPRAQSEAPRAKDARPGTWTNGNTTIHMGGSVSTEFGVGGGSRRR